MNQKIRKTKKMMAVMALTVIMVVSMLSAIGPVRAGDQAVLTLVPSEPVDLTYPNVFPLEKTFTVQVRISGATNLWGFVFDLYWNPDVVQVTRIQKGPFLSNDGEYTDNNPPTTIDNVNGHLPSKFNQVLMEDVGVSGDGVLAIVTFKVVGYGKCDIALTDLLMRAPGNQPIIDGVVTPLPILTVNNPTPPASSPTADFTVTSTDAEINGLYITIPAGVTDATIVLDASSSLPGYDGENTIPITSYSWQIQSIAGKFDDISALGSKYTLDGIEEGVIKVTLTVTAPAEDAPSQYVSTDTKVREYTILQLASTGIDVYTQNGGNGPDVPSEPFGPYQTVTVTAHVFFNGAPVADVLVAFEILNSEGKTYATAVAFTNSAGDATYSFRLPTGSTMAFGTWSICASTAFSETTSQDFTAFDTLTFDFKYIANIQQISVAPDRVIRGTDDVVISVTIETTGKVSGKIVVTIVDANNVPVAVTSTSFDSTTTSTNFESLNIPVSAFVGMAKVNVNLLSDFPQNGGVPYCPQNGVDVDTGVQNQPGQLYIGFA